MINHCDDNSDEFYCDKIRIDERVYDKDMAPVGKFDKDKRMTVKLNITDFLLEEIDFVRSEFIARFNLHMEWRDERLTFLNLQPGTRNIIPYSEISKKRTIRNISHVSKTISHFSEKIWLPVLEFIKSPESTETTTDGKLLVQIVEGEGQIENDLTRRHEDVIFEGENCYLKSQRIYNEKFICDFDMERCVRNSTLGNFNI